MVNNEVWWRLIIVPAFTTGSEGVSSFEEPLFVSLSTKEAVDHAQEPRSVVEQP